MSLNSGEGNLGWRQAAKNYRAIAGRVCSTPHSAVREALGLIGGMPRWNWSTQTLSSTVRREPLASRVNVPEIRIERNIASATRDNMQTTLSARGKHSFYVPHCDIVVHRPHVLDTACHRHGRVNRLLRVGCAREPNHTVLVRFDMNAGKAGQMILRQFRLDDRCDRRVAHEHAGAIRERIGIV